MSAYLEKRRAIMLGLQPPDAKKEPKPIPRVSEKKRVMDAAEKAAGFPNGGKKFGLKTGQRSEKMKGIMAAIKPLYKSFLSTRPYCEIRSPVCTSEATCIHHTAGRGMDHLMDMNTWEAACDACNKYVEANDAWARENGHKYSKHKKN